MAVGDAGGVHDFGKGTRGESFGLLEFQSVTKF